MGKNMCEKCQVWCENGSNCVTLGSPERERAPGRLGRRTGRSSAAETVVPSPRRTGESKSSSVGVLVVVLVIKNVVLRFNLLKLFVVCLEKFNFCRTPQSRRDGRTHNAFRDRPMQNQWDPSTDGG